jgi:hypothetical protein
VLFSEEKNQKTFNSCAGGTIVALLFRTVGEEINVFCFFFSKKKAFLIDLT